MCPFAYEPRERPDSRVDETALQRPSERGMQLVGHGHGMVGHATCGLSLTRAALLATLQRPVIARLS